MAVWEGTVVDRYATRSIVGFFESQDAPCIGRQAVPVIVSYGCIGVSCTGLFIMIIIAKE